MFTTTEVTAVPPVPTPVPVRVRSPWLVLAVAATAVFVVFLDTTALFVAYPDLRASFPSVSAANLSWVLNAYTITFAALLIPSGRLADRIGRKRVFLTGSVLFAAASALCGIAPNPNVLVLARVIQAAGAAALVPASLAVILRAFPRERIPVAVAIWGAVGALAAAAGPTFGAAMVEWFGWRSVFYINLPITVVAVVCARRILVESKEDNPGPIPDIVSVILLAAGVAVLSLAVVQGDGWGWASALTLGSFAIAVVLLAVFIARCASVAAPLIELDLFRANNFRWANLAMFTYAIGFTATFFANIQFLTSVWGYSVLRAGFAIVPGPLIVATLAPTAGRIAARYGQRVLLVPGGLLWAASTLWLITRVDASPHYVTHWLPSVVLTGIAVAMCLPQLSSAAVQGLPSDRYASGSAINQALRQLGSTIGVALVVAFAGVNTPLNVVDHFRLVWWMIVVSGVAVAAAASLLKTTGRATVPVRR
ncbi:MAG: MFS transporter [Actinobacteria bacterium]|nr:MAG: MFS transporter [Actinomycetota bacterium]